MPTIAIAGGTGNIGQTVAEVLKENPEYNVIVLSRKAPVTQVPKAPVFVTAYDDVDGLAKFFESNNVHTVISAIQVMGPESGSAEMNLVHAAAKSPPTKRFIASDWGIPFPAASEQSVQHQIRAATMAELRTTRLEWTTIHIGFIADYFGIPHIKSHMRPLSIFVDMANKEAVIPGTGNEVLSFTYSFDVAKFVEALLGLAQWEEETFCYGDNCTFNEVVEMAEGATGSRFSVTYDDIEKLKRGDITEMSSHSLSYGYFPKPILQATYAQFGLYVLAGLFHMPEERSINKKFPQLKTTSVSEIVGAWKGV